MTWAWIRGPGQRGFPTHSRRLKYAGDAQTPVGIDAYLPDGHRWEILSSPNRGGSSYGIWVYARELCHDNAELLYAHLSKETVQVGRRYPGGTRCGVTGDSGGTSGPHLHFETDRDFWSWTKRIWTPAETKEWDEMATKAEIEDVVRDIVREECSRIGEQLAEWAVTASVKAILGRDPIAGYAGDMPDSYQKMVRDAIAEAKQREAAQHP